MTDLVLFILFAENSQILLKIFVIPILLTFIYLVALLVNNQLNTSLRHMIVTNDKSYENTGYQHSFNFSTAKNFQYQFYFLFAMVKKVR